MNTPLKLAALFVVLISLMFVGNTVLAKTAHAQSMPNTQIITENTEHKSNFIPLEVTPVCADDSSNLAYWKVVNKNSEAAEIRWENHDTNIKGEYLAPSGLSEMTTHYEADAGNNRTGFIWNGEYSSTNSQNVPCTTEVPIEPPVTCSDGRIQQNLSVLWIAENTVAVTTSNTLPLCEDVEVFFSSYVMPAHYDGGPFYGNTTAYPQHIFSSVSIVLKKGTTGNALMALDLPDRCNNIQVDVYYAPEIEVVLENGHGTQNIVSKVYLSEGSCEESPVTPETPVTPTLPTPPVTNPQTPAPTLPVEASQGNGAVMAEKQTELTTPKELPATGPREGVSAFIAPLVAALLTYVSLYFLLPTKQR
jgi:hypothetical protein